MLTIQIIMFENVRPFGLAISKGKYQFVHFIRCAVYK